MSRALTQQELEEYNKRRKKSLEETAKKFGLTPEQLETAEQRARKELNNRHVDNKEEAAAALRAALDKIGSGLLESLKTDNMREALDTVQDVDGMSNEDFGTLLAQRMAILDEDERREAAKMVGRKIACWRGGEDEPLSLREEILLDLQSMIRRHNYYADKA